MYRYQVKPGAEDRIFGGDNVRNLGGGIVESDHELNSPYLTLVPEKETQQMTATAELPPVSKPSISPASEAPGGNS